VNETDSSSRTEKYIYVAHIDYIAHNAQEMNNMNEIEFRGETFCLTENENIEDVQESIAQIYHEIRGSLQHSCEGTSDAQRFKFEEAIMVLDLEYYDALCKIGLDGDCICDMYRCEDRAFYLAFEGVDGGGYIQYFSDPQHLLAAIKDCNRRDIGWSVLDDECLRSDTYNSDEVMDGDINYTDFEEMN